MRSWSVAVATAALLIAATGCTTGTASKSAAFAGPGGTSSDGGSGGAVIDSAVCDQVRQGIDAFNQGDFDATVDHFTQAVPLAHERVVAEDSRANEQLLEAVVYYARLAPEDYLAAAQTSPDFAKYKAITLGQCEGGAPATPAPESSSPGTAV